MNGHGGSTVRFLVTVALLAGAAPRPARAQAASPAAPPSAGAPVDNPIGIPDFRAVLPTADTREGMQSSLKIVVLLTLLALAPSILIMTTSFTRIGIVLSLLRRAIGTHTLPPSQVLIGLSLFMTFVVMGPTWQKIHAEAVQPWLDNALGMTQAKALDIATGHLRTFMFDQIERAGHEESIYLFYEHGRGEPVPTGATLRRADVSTMTLIPAFMLSEIETAFVMGFRIYLPFLVIDMVIASVLVSMGMMMLPPVLISLPFKILLFVLADGWELVVNSLLMSFGG